MKRDTLLLLACASLCGAASAQSTVTIFGIADVMLTRGNGSLAGKTALASGGLQSSRVGFRGVEDLGGGLKASFHLEAQFFLDTGEGQATNTNNQTSGTTTAPVGTQGLSFARRSTVSLEGPWGELRAGRDFSSQYRNRLELDPYGSAGVGTIQPFIGSLGGPVSTRASNMVGYYLPRDLGGLYGQFQVYLGENASNQPADDGTGVNMRLGYQWGPLNVSASAARTEYVQAATTGDILTQNLGVHYQLGPVKLLTGVFRDVVYRTNQPLRGKGWTAGGIWAVGPGEVKFALSEYGTDAPGRPEARKLSLGYVHNLSKRTALYTTWARVSNAGGAAFSLNGAATKPNRTSTGMDFGIRHLF
ncbi:MULTISPECIES: porin [unclassified Acidovorax]|uniref:porin n=1 Tax=unclassified Acidovorax TaxID=2684926 RepID=UPI001C4954BC|nr:MULTISPECIES: porin [unclassified Acidovorax]MBV7429334.1 porin [Acidovorax sp. sif0732]MBV7451160.1 porin [Acidovorax sp. sif0715]